MQPSSNSICTKTKVEAYHIVGLGVVPASSCAGEILPFNLEVYMRRSTELDPIPVISAPRSSDSSEGGHCLVPFGAGDVG